MGGKTSLLTNFACPRVYEDTLIVYYSDQRDSNYGQKLVHQETTDLYNWSDVIDDVTYPTYTDRPGMPIVTQLPNGSYFYVSPPPTVLPGEGDRPPALLIRLAPPG